MQDDLTAYIRYRLEKAQETYRAAEVLYEAKMWNSVINRLYYACYYSVSALLLYNHLSAKTHSGIISSFSENFVRKGIITTEEFHVYSKLLNWRSKGDYSDLFDFTEEDVTPLMKRVKPFIDKIEGLVALEH